MTTEMSYYGLLFTTTIKYLRLYQLLLMDHTLYQHCYEYAYNVFSLPH